MKKKILINTLGLLTISVAAALLMMALLMYNMQIDRVMRTMRVEAQVLAAASESEQPEAMFGRLEEDVRVTVILPDGIVAYDNAVDWDEMDNHADRPEILEASQSGEGWSIRESKTLETSTFYYAMRMEDGRIFRVAQRMTSIWNIYCKAIPAVVVLLLAIAALGAIAADRMTERLLKPISQMTVRLGGRDGTAVYPELEPFVATIEKQHEEILRNANIRVEFTANVSHELKTPLTSISGYAELIESGMAKGEQAERFASEIKRSASRLMTLINDTIRLSQMDSPVHEVEMEPVDLAQVAEHVVEHLQINAGRASVNLELKAQPVIIDADRQMMEELIYNLCDNAIRYNKQGGSVVVEVQPVAEKALMIVRDTGIGIGREHRERVFERFYRVDKSRSKATGGTGLGLAIVKHIAVKHSAQIQLESELGRGTTITVAFDRKKNDGRTA